MRNMFLCLFLVLASASTLEPRHCEAAASRTFDGSGDRIVTNGSVYDPKGVPFTTGGWFYVTVNNVLDNFISVDFASGTFDFGFFLFGNDVQGAGVVQTQIAHTGGGDYFVRKSDNGMIGTNAWTYMLTAHDGTFTDYSKCHMYANGSEVAYGGSQQNGSGTETNHEENWVFGGYTNNASYSITGQAAYAVTVGRVIADYEMQEMMWKPDMANNSLKLLLPIWGDATEMDLSGNGKTGTVTNTSTSTNGPPVMFGGGLPL